MRILVTGKGGSTGSWVVRGEQLGAALGATVRPLATLTDVQACDVAVVVKRTPRCALDALALARKPWVFDLVDFYPQPEASGWSRTEAISWVRTILRQLKPTAVIWPTHRMREDCDTGLPGMVLRHHFRPGIRKNPVREQIRKIGYEGESRYLAEWRPALQALCERRGWSFVVNPDHLADLDAVVALRGGRWNGYVQQSWKSNVKLANAHGSGTPFIGQRECGYFESATGCEYWATKPPELEVAIDWLISQSAREQVQDRFLQAAYSVQDAAADLSKFLHAL